MIFLYADFSCFVWWYLVDIQKNILLFMLLESFMSNATMSYVSIIISAN